FPNIPFSVFSKFIEDNFISTVSLSTVLMVLFTITENTDLMSLHFRQRSAELASEKSTSATGWIRNLGSAVQRRLDKDQETLLKESDIDAAGSKEKATISLGLKMDGLARVLQLCPITKAGRYKGKLKPVSQRQIQPVYTVCPLTATCQTASCNKASLYQATRPRDIPFVRLIKNFSVHDEVEVYSGQCKECNTIYYADHERAKAPLKGTHERVYLNSAMYIKIGQKLWVDRMFTRAVLDGIYTFHASAAAYTEFWNRSFDMDGRGGVSRRQVWQAFVQESLRLVASASEMHLTIPDGLPIDEVTKHAYDALGKNGVIQCADDHACPECTQKYKRSADVIQDENVADMFGMEQGIGVEEQAIEEDEEAAPVKMVVIDGIVMGHTVSFYCMYNHPSHSDKIVSTVHLKVVIQSWPMLVAGSIVHSMS
ncbi:hypothetical protein M378DRAFT_93385, partial [Amanita muscaria Koide BX008]